MVGVCRTLFSHRKLSSDLLINIITRFPSIEQELRGAPHYGDVIDVFS